ncbi:hypothetical protein [Rhodococcus xishaensis]|uniref:hypothetical protein n=1 Tax=Rhodococcus xishaensis TaxID=2487364 RepID=UPI0013E3B2E7|nr:hypothetical protein [Rhodococcus xishaensis]
MTETLWTETPNADGAPVRVREDAILGSIPHRYPFLLVDRVEVADEDKTFAGNGPRATP